MSEGVAKIVGLERRVMWRQRLLSLQDCLALAVGAGGIIAAVLVLLVRVRLLHLPVWAILSGVLGVSSTVALTRWFFSRAHQRDAAFLIDEFLRLEDRVATSHTIIARGGPNGALEEAQIEDAAKRAGDASVSSVVPLRIKRSSAFAPVSVIALVAALMIAPRALPVTEALVAERTDIDNAADHLEQAAAEVEKTVPAGTETARLANEQTELGRALRRSTATRAEALKRLSGLEERIRRRQNDLASTHVDEIVTLADRRLGGALSTLSTAQPKKPRADEERPAAPTERNPDRLNHETQENGSVRPGDGRASNSSSANRNSGSSTLADRARPADDQTKVKDSKTQEAVKSPKRLQEPVSGQKPAPAKDSRIDPLETPPRDAIKSVAAPDKMAIDQNREDQKTNAENATAKRNAKDEKGSQQPTDKLPGATDALKATPDLLLNQAAKTLPKLSEDLLKKAAQLRANELSPADIEKLRKAADFLSRDLAQIGQSKELQHALQEMARQVSPEQIEQVARELGNNEKLKQELESAARLLADNQKAKEIVAGLAGEFARVRDEVKTKQRNERHDGDQSVESGSGNKPPGGGDRASRVGAAGFPDRPGAPQDGMRGGQGRESRLQGKLQQSSRGEYLYLQSRAGAGSARAPYSSAYPQYRREAERSVQRTQVPGNLRSLVRKYFDAINPDSKR